MPIEPASYSTVIVETTIAADPARVWRALTDEMGAWWPAEFYAGGEPGARTMKLDARPGGLMIEHWGGDAGVVWATVNAVERGRHLEMSGLVFPKWGGPSMWLGSWELEGDGGRTRLRFTEAAVGRLADNYLEEKEKSWRFLFDGALKAHLEGREPPTWQG